MLPNFNNNGPCFELFSSATDILKYWKQKGKIIKEFETHTKSYVYYLQHGGVSMLSIPINEKHSLQINNSSLLFQFILFNNKSFSIEIGIKDKSDTKRRFNLTSSIKENESKSLYVKIPLNDYPLNIWTNLVIDIEALTKQYFKTQTFKNLDNIHISGCLKIRKILSLRSKDEPILKTADMGKSIPIVNLFLSESGNLIKKDIKIIGINNININNININSETLQNIYNNPSRGYRKNDNSPPTNNISKFSNTSDVNANRYKNYYRKSNEINNNIKINENKNNSKELLDNINITPFPNSNSKKTKDNIKFAKGLTNATYKINEIQYNANKNIKNAKEKYIGNNNMEEIEGSNKLLNNNVKGKSLGKYVYKHQKNKKRNKSNNPYAGTNLNKKISENSDDIRNNSNNKNIGNKNLTNLENNIGKTNDNNIINKKEKKLNKNNNIATIKENKNKEIQNNNNYYNKKEQEFSMEDFQESFNNQQNVTNEDKTKSNSFAFSNNSLVNKNSIKENNDHHHNPGEDNKTNKYSNYNNMLLDSHFDIRNIPVYDSIEEIAEWPADLKVSENNAINEGIEKMGDKLIHLDSGNTHYNNKDQFRDTGDFLEITSLLKNKDTLRPYTPPLEELVQVNPSNMKGESNVKCSIDRRDKKNAFMSTNRILKNYENLIYNQDKGLFYDPKTDIYYDIKAK